MPLIPCTLVHHTGTIVRFRPSQLGQLPTTDVDVSIQVPSGSIVQGHFRRHPDNPNISGRGIVYYIKRHQSFGANTAALIDMVGVPWRLYNVTDAIPIVEQAGIASSHIRDARMTGNDITRLVRLADKYRDRIERRRAYARLLRPPCLRRMILDLMGASCQVDGCASASDTLTQWNDPAAMIAIVEVHHIEALAQVVDHHPSNLCVLCANHHRLIHGFGPWLVRHKGDNVTFTKGARSLTVVRNLATL